MGDLKTSDTDIRVNNHVRLCYCEAHKLDPISHNERLKTCHYELRPNALRFKTMQEYNCIDATSGILY